MFYRNTLSFIDIVKRYLNNCESYEEYAKFIELIAEGKSSQRIGFEDPFAILKIEIHQNFPFDSQN